MEDFPARESSRKTTTPEREDTARLASVKTRVSGTRAAAPSDDATTFLVLSTDFDQARTGGSARNDTDGDAVLRPRKALLLAHGDDQHAHRCDGTI